MPPPASGAQGWVPSPGGGKQSANPHLWFQLGQRRCLNTAQQTERLKNAPSPHTWFASPSFRPPAFLLFYFEEGSPGAALADPGLPAQSRLASNLARSLLPLPPESWRRRHEQPCSAPRILEMPACVERERSHVAAPGNEDNPPWASVSRLSLPRYSEHPARARPPRGGGGGDAEGGSVDLACRPPGPAPRSSTRRPKAEAQRGGAEDRREGEGSPARRLKKFSTSARG